MPGALWPRISRTEFWKGTSNMKRLFASFVHNEGGVPAKLLRQSRAGQDQAQPFQILQVSIRMSSSPAQNRKIRILIQ